MSPKLTVVFVIGFTRSGTTLFGDVVGALDGLCGTGELQYQFWRRGVLRNTTCSCGKPFEECGFWRDVLAHGFGSDRPDEVEAEELFDLQQRYVRTRYIPRYLGHRVGDALPPGLDRYLNAVSRLYLAVGAVSGAPAVVDTSKWAAYGALLRLVPGISPVFVHLVRDPRAVAYSWRRPPKPGFRQIPPGYVARQWLKFNLAASVVCRHNQASLCVRYEDFIENPRSVLGSVARLVGAPVESLPLVGEHAVRLPIRHSVWGNTNRFESGVMALREDDEWRTRIDPGDRRLVTAITLPALHAFGYPVRVAE